VGRVAGHRTRYLLSTLRSEPAALNWEDSVPTAVINYRLPSLAVLQVAPIEPISFQEAGVAFTIWPPDWDERFSARGGWIGRENPLFRLGDVLRVNVSVPVPTDAAQLDFYADIHPIAERVAAKLITWLIVETNQYWLGISPVPFAWAGHPIGWDLYDDGGAVISNERTEHLHIGEEFWLTDERWRRIGERMAGGQVLPLPRVLLLESHGHRAAGNYRSAVLNCAMACEIGVKSFVTECGALKDPLYPYVVEKDREVSMLEYLGEVMKLLTGDDLKGVLDSSLNGEKIGFTQLRRLFEARNKVAHEGVAYYRTGGKRQWR
jgi:hypothetical protein